MIKVKVLRHRYSDDLYIDIPPIYRNSLKVEEGDIVVITVPEAYPDQIIVHKEEKKKV